VVPDSAMSKVRGYSTLEAEMEIFGKKASKALSKAKGSKTSLRESIKGEGESILEKHLGKVPEHFTVGGEEYTPLSYRDSLGIVPSDYMTFSSRSQGNFHTWSRIESPDNQLGIRSFNVPLEEFISILFSSVEKGYTATWIGDISEKGFSPDGVALLSDPSRGGVSSVSQESREEGFVKGWTTDDHAMHAFGIARDQWGGRYLMVKNSWGKTGRFAGIWYLSEEYCLAKTLAFTVHKDAVGEGILSKTGQGGTLPPKKD